MKSVAQETPFGSTIFCDDIRHEIGGKFSYIGIYTGTINFNQPLPQKLSKFAFAIKYSERPGESTENVNVRIYMPGDPEDEPHTMVELPMDDIRANIPPREKLENAQDPILTTTFHIAMENVEFKENGLIKVRAYRGDLEVRMGTIQVQYTPPPD